ncbi:MAG: tetratricopeptide repeat protein [Cyclobacteriaceae bacterium]|nr:tetratricopeptide repeat protein [Cyclobacteriaceae bacterium]
MRGFFKFLLIGLTIQLTVFPLIAQKKKAKKETVNNSQIRESEYYFTEAEKYFILEDYAKALALFQKSIETDPQNDAAYYKKGQIELKDGNITSALSSVQKALELSPQNKYYYLLIIDLYTQTGDFDKVAEYYEKLTSTIKGTEMYLFELASLHMYLKNNEKALALYNRLEEFYGYSTDIAFQKQKIYTQLNKKEEALQVLEETQKRFPDQENVVIAHSELLISMNKDAQAIANLTQFLIEYGPSSRASLLIGEIHRKNKEYEKAYPFIQKAFEDPSLPVDIKVQLIAQYRTLEKKKELTDMVMGLCETLVNLHTNEPNAHSVFGDFYQELGQIASAADQYEMSVKLDPTNFAVWQNLLFLKMQVSAFEEVIKLSDKALEMFPNQSLLYYMNGLARIRNESYREAIQMLQIGKRLAGSNESAVTDFNSLLGEAYNYTEDFEKSDLAYNQVLSMSPDNYIVLNNYSYFLALRNDKLDLAEKMSSKLIKDNPNNPTFLDTHAWVLYTRKKYKEAKKTIEKALTIENTTAVYFEHYGDILYKLNDIDGAVEQWQKARGMDSTLFMIDKKIADRKLYEK